MAVYGYPYPSYTWPYQGVDFAGISGMNQQLANAMFDDGIRFVGRYLYASQYPNGKGLSAAEADFYLNAGLSIYLYYEVNTSDALGGYARGQQNGYAALQQIIALGIPIDTMVYCCCDTSVTDAQAAGVVMDYLDGFASEVPNYKVGIYGGQNVMAACYAHDPDKCRIQAGAWGSYEFDPINLRQWMIAYNGNAKQDGYIQIANVQITNGYATWRGNSVDLCSAPDLSHMWSAGGPQPPTPPGPGPESGKLPIWMYLKRF